MWRGRTFVVKGTALSSEADKATREPSAAVQLVKPSWGHISETHVSACDPPLHACKFQPMEYHMHANLREAWVGGESLGPRHESQTAGQELRAWRGGGSAPVGEQDPRAQGEEDAERFGLEELEGVEEARES
jgi:hypothetical protein